MSISKMYSVFIIVFALTVCSCSQKQSKLPPINPDNFKVEFGVLQRQGKEILENTNILKQFTNVDSYSVGYIITSKNDVDFEEYSIAYPPSPAKAGKLISSLKDGFNGLKSGTNKSKNGVLVHRYYFTQGDPLGEWKLDIYINEQFYKTLYFTVVSE